MNSFELNKIFGAILGTLLFIMGIGFLAEAIYHPIEGRGPGYTLPEPEAGGVGEGGSEEAEEAPPIGVLLASADAEAGAGSARKCQGCHNFGAGEPNKQGPGLYDVVERTVGTHEGFAYSPGMQAHAAAGDRWTYENLNTFLTAPKSFTPDTKMNFPGLKNPQERANVIAYLSTLSEAPKPFPAPEATADVNTEAAASDEATTEATPTDANAIQTPTETQTDTPVQGTPTTSGPGEQSTPAAEPVTDTPDAGSVETPTETPANTTPAAPAVVAPASPADATPAPQTTTAVPQ